jgi:nicotinate phosphoribosyltransferase
MTPERTASLLATDFYQLNMVESYLATGMTDTAVFEMFVRDLAPERGYILAAGLEQVLAFLEDPRPTAEELGWLRSTGQFTGRLVDFLAEFRFEGDVHAPPEGTVLFDDEPLVRVTAPLPQAQLLETVILNVLHYQTLVASKAARMRLAMPGVPLVDFGLRRAHGLEAGVLAARAAYIAGFEGTATVPAAQLFGVPLYGTMAHSYVLAHESEEAAFLAYARTRPSQTIFLIDTYDTPEGARTLARIAPTLRDEGIGIRGVRLDSGDLDRLSRDVRTILDEAGLEDAMIMASGGIDEFGLARLREAGAPIEGYGLGTALVVSKDLPSLDTAYKLKAYAGVPRRKLSSGKAYWPGATQVHRRYGPEGRLLRDRLVAADEPVPEGAEAVLEPVIREGRRLRGAEGVEAARERAARELAALPPAQTALRDARSFEPEVSERLQALGEAADARFADG